MITKQDLLDALNKLFEANTKDLSIIEFMNLKKWIRYLPDEKTNIYKDEYEYLQKRLDKLDGVFAKACQTREEIITRLQIENIRLRNGLPIPSEKESQPTPKVITRKELGEFMFWHGVADDIILDVFIKHFKGRIVE